mmetsp:Transcript_62816/g.141901  ORF Transcript_62816/g.141901 Transcript_62816/m.141901 type:complete len:214 (+) Transcript_62816:542-1183(+)
MREKSRPELFSACILAEMRCRLLLAAQIAAFECICTVPIRAKFDFNDCACLPEASPWSLQCCFTSAILDWTLSTSRRTPPRSSMTPRAVVLSNSFSSSNRAFIFSNRSCVSALFRTAVSISLIRLGGKYACVDNGSTWRNDIPAGAGTGRSSTLYWPRRRSSSSLRVLNMFCRAVLTASTICALDFTLSRIACRNVLSRPTTALVKVMLNVSS